MIVGLLMTDGGPHPPEKLAAVTVQHFLDDFQENAPLAAYSEVMAFRDEIDQVMIRYHREFQEMEREALEKIGPERLLDVVDTDEFAEKVVDEILQLMSLRLRSGGPFTSLIDYFHRPETKGYFTRVLNDEFHGSAMIQSTKLRATVDSGESGDIRRSLRTSRIARVFTASGSLRASSCRSSSRTSSVSSLPSSR